MYIFPDYLSQFTSINSENNSKNDKIQLTVEEQIKRLNKGTYKHYLLV